MTPPRKRAGAAPPPDAPHELRRADVLRHVTALIADHGIDGMTMRQVALATGLSTGTLNYHFGNKRGMVLATLAFAGNGAPTGELEAASSVEALRGVLGGFVLDAPERRAWWQFWVEVTAHGMRDTELREREQARHTTQRAQLEDLLADGARRGELRGDLDLGGVADGLLALACGLAMRQLAAPEDASAVARAGVTLDAALRELASVADGSPREAR